MNPQLTCGRRRWLSRRRPAAVAAIAAAAVGLGGCAESATSEEPAPIGTLSPGPADAPSNFFGVAFRPCSTIELEGYPANLARASEDYYAGPWCARVGADRSYLWAYARPLTEDQTAKSVNANVAADAEQLVLDVEAQGYHRVCGAVVPESSTDAGFERDDEPSRLRITTRGQVADPPQATSTEPLSLVIALSPSERDPAVPEGAVAPPC